MGSVIITVVIILGIVIVIYSFAVKPNKSAGGGIGGATRPEPKVGQDLKGLG